MTLLDLKRKLKKGIALLIRFIKNPAFTYDDFFQFEFEKKMGIVTRGFVRETDLGISLVSEPHHYVPGGNVYLKKVLRKMNITNTDAAIDLGCGLGSAMLYMYKFPFKQITGIEFSQILYQGCLTNINKLHSSRINVHYGDAARFDALDEYNYIFMFNPFGLSTMTKVLNNIYNSYIKRPRKITLIYKNPVYSKEVIATGIFHKVGEYKTESQFNFYIFSTQNTQ